MKNKNEKGVALILTLGILAFLLVLALGFVSSAILQKKAAVNSASGALSRLLAESATEKCLAGLAYYTDAVATAAFDIVYSQEKTDPSNSETFDCLYRISTTQNGVNIYQWPSSTYNKSSADALHWQYVDNGSTLDKRLIGRYAYVVIPSGGKLNPGYCVSHQNTYPDGTARDESGVPQERKGKDVCEIPISRLVSSIPHTYLSAGNLTDLSTTIVGGKLVDGGIWADLDTIFAPANLNITNENQKMYWNEWFAVNNVADNEKFWIDNNGNGLQDVGEFYHRFNIARPVADWNALTVHDIFLAPIIWGAADNHGVGIPWLSNWNESSGNWPNALTKKRQIAANLIDYCDSNSEATNDSTVDPTYTGNDFTPYINEIGVNIECSTRVTLIAGPSRLFQYDILVTLGVERIDMYSGLPAFNAVATVLEGDLRYRYRKSDGTLSPMQTLSLNMLSTTISQGSVPGYNMAWGGSTSVSITDNTGNSVNAGLVDVSVQIKRLRLECPVGIFADFAKPDYSGGWSQTIATFATRNSDGGPTTEQGYFSYQIDDPRHNLNDADWDQATAQVAANYNAGGGTQSTINVSKVTCTSSGDAEPASSPTNISTALIRNAPMETPWELGFIHRAAKWETINLKRYNSDDNDDGTVASNEYGVSSAFGGRAYSKGDANILDQVKMHINHSIPGKFNIRAPQNLDVLRALLGSIKVGQDPITWAGGTTLTYTSAIAGEVPFLANAIFSSSQRPFITRAQVAKVSSLSDGSLVPAQNTDAKKEEIIGKFINLTKTDVADEFVILVIAQSIKDIGGGITIYKDLNYDGDTSDNNLDGTAGDPGFFWNGTAPVAPSLPNLVDEQIVNCQFGVYDLGADEILAEQKILVRVKYDASEPVGQRWKIMRYEYLEN